MNKKRIVMMVANEVSSDPRVTKEAAELAASYDVTVIGLRRMEEVADSERLQDFDIVRADVRDLQRKHRVYRKLAELIKLGFRAVKEKNVASFHAHDFEMLPFAYIASRVRKARLVYDSHELWIEQRADFPKWFKWIVKKVEGFFIRQADRVITVNRSISKELKMRYRLDQSPLILHNFTKKIDLPSIANADQDKVIVLYHGGYIKDRGLNELIEAAYHFPDRVILQLRGMGPLEPELRKLAAPLIQSGKVQFLAPVPMNRLVHAAREAHIGIIPYQPTCLNNLYSLPNKLSEYAMAGLSVCASDLPEINALNNSVRFGELFDPYDPKSIAAAVSRMTADKQILKQFQIRAWNWAQTTGNWEHERSKLLNLYDKLLGEA
ncbi:glycosyltransferase [Paenibacillus naphthalenovorans]|uniref:glycosyltransferase n=1 Tax=Paenibacillus naphthalenovorans TaxID=162209 RepID=UPI003D26F189